MKNILAFTHWSNTSSLHNTQLLEVEKRPWKQGQMILETVRNCTATSGITHTRTHAHTLLIHTWSSLTISAGSCGDGLLEWTGLLGGEEVPWENLLICSATLPWECLIIKENWVKWRGLTSMLRNVFYLLGTKRKGMAFSKLKQGILSITISNKCTSHENIHKRGCTYHRVLTSLNKLFDPLLVLLLVVVICWRLLDFHLVTTVFLSQQSVK